NDEWRSPSLGSSALPFDPGTLKNPAALVGAFDDLQLQGKHLRRGSLQISPPQVVFCAPLGGPRLPPQGPGPPARPSGPARPPPLPFEQPQFVVQAASETDKLDGMLARFRSERDQALAREVAKADESLEDLRRGLLLIGLLTFAAAALGGLWLVRLGLAPLQR